VSKDRVRVVGPKARPRTSTVGLEVRTLHVNGPAGGGGGSNALREVLGVKSLLLPRERVNTQIVVEGRL
jgi:hypothetical protein